MEFRLDHPELGIKTILVIFDGVPYEADSNHPWWNEIVQLAIKDDERVVDLFPIRPFQKPSEYFADPALEALDQEGRHAHEEAREEAWNAPICPQCHLPLLVDGLYVRHENCIQVIDDDGETD